MQWRTSDEAALTPFTEGLAVEAESDHTRDIETLMSVRSYDVTRPSKFRCESTRHPPPGTGAVDYRK